MLVGEAWKEEAVQKPQAYMEEYDYNGTQKGGWSHINLIHFTEHRK